MGGRESSKHQFAAENSFYCTESTSALHELHMIVLLPNEGANLLPFLPSLFALPLRLSSSIAQNESAVMQNAISSCRL
jgi:hypothetical protein